MPCAQRLAWRRVVYSNIQRTQLGTTCIYVCLILQKSTTCILHLRFYTVSFESFTFPKFQYLQTNQSTSTGHDLSWIIGLTGLFPLQMASHHCSYGCLHLLFPYSLQAIFSLVGWYL